MNFGVITSFDGRPGRTMSDLRVTARHVEDAGLHSLWFPEHVVFFRDYSSRYPYAPDGDPRFGKRPGTYDPLFAATVAAGATTRIRVGTGILILPQRNPVVLAQEVVAVDHASDGRLDLGIGVGWSREEFDALGIDWAERGRRTDEYVGAMTALWTQELCSFAGSTVSFRDVIAEPKPIQRPRPPIWVGGGRGPAMRRAAQVGDGWYGWGLSAAEVPSSMAELNEHCVRIGRDPSTLQRKIGTPCPGPLSAIAPLVEAAAAHGVSELVLAIGVPGVDLRARVDELALLATTL